MEFLPASQEQHSLIDGMKSLAPIPKRTPSTADEKVKKAVNDLLDTLNLPSGTRKKVISRNELIINCFFTGLE